MKKILATMFGVVVGAALVHAQGFIITQGSGAGITTNTGTLGNTSVPNQGAGFSTIIAGKTPTSGGYDYALLASTTDITDGPTDAGWAQVTQSGGASLALVDYAVLAGGLGGAGGTGGIATDLAAGTTYYVTLVGWSTSLGTSWSAVESQLASGTWSAQGWFGETSVATMTPAVAAGPTDPIISPGTWSSGSLVLYSVPVPEPTTLALAGLGGLSMLFLRRRKS